MYEDAKSLKKAITRAFLRTKETLFYIDSNTKVIDQINLLYKKILRLSKEAYLDMASKAYKNHDGPGKITEAWVIGILDDYDPVVKYVFTNELERKGAKFAESIIADAEHSGKDPPTVNYPPIKKDFTRGLNYVTWQTDQFAINVEDNATLKAYKDSGIKKVKWNTHEDEKTCEVCRERDGKIYFIDKIPTKHPNCRCFFTPEKA